MARIVIIGNSAAGVSAAEQIRKQDQGVSITLVGDEMSVAYRRYLITEVLDGNLKESDLVYKGEDFYANNNINILLGRKAERVITRKNQVYLSDKTKIEYDVLIVASGVSMQMPKELKGMGKHGVIGIRSLADVKDISNLIPISSNAIIWGTGISGLRCASVLCKKGLELKIIAEGDQLLPGILDQAASKIFEKVFRSHNIDLQFNKTVAEVFGNGDVKAIKLGSGKVVACGILIVDKFYRPNVKFIEDLELALDNGVPVDNYLNIPNTNIFAAGDVIKDEHAGYFDKPISWELAQEQGRVAASNTLMKIHGRSSEMIAYNPPILGKNLVFFNLAATCFGEISPKPEPGVEELLFINSEENKYKKIVLKNSRIIGYISVGDISGSEVIFKLMQAQLPVDSIKDNLAAEHMDFEKLKPFLE